MGEVGAKRRERVPLAGTLSRVAPLRDLSRAAGEVYLAVRVHSSGTRSSLLPCWIAKPFC